MTVVVVVWLAAVVVMLVRAVALQHEARREGAGPVGRGRVLAWAGAIAAIAAASVWVWSGALARGARPRAVARVELKAVHAAAGTEIVEPESWATAIDVAPGEAVQLGDASGAVPGLRTWELPAPRGHGDVLVVPENPAGALTLGIYELELRRRAPDVAAIDARAGWAASLLVLAPVLALLVLAVRRRGAVDRVALARLAAIGWLAVVLAAIAVWRLAWAHRIDLLRELDLDGTRVMLARLLVIATAAVLAAASVAVLVPGWPGKLRRPRMPELGAPALLAGVAVLAVAISLGAPRLVAAKLVLAWTIPIVAYQALRAALLAGSLQAVGLALAAVATALAALFRLDPGVTVAIAAPGVVAAVVVVTHDLLYQPRDARLLDRWERHQRPLSLGHAALLAGAAIAVLVGAMLVTDAGLPARATRAALHGAGLIALALAAAALLARRRGAGALVPAALALVAALIWFQRGALLDRAVGSDDPSGRRLAAVVAPGYALLRDESRLVAALTAWRETAVAGSSWTGDGWFAATIGDPGVAVSIENDYLAVLLVRETGVAGTSATAALLLLAIGGAWSLGAAARRPGAPGTRRRSVAALGLGAVTVYQPLAALGILPLTGVSWPGLGLDSPSDVLVHLGLLAWLAAPGRSAADAHELAVRAAPGWRRAGLATAAAVSLAIVAGVAIVARGAAHAAARDPATVADGVDRAEAYAASLACPVPASPSLDTGVPTELLAAPTDPATARFHRELVARWQLARPGIVAAARAFAAGGACPGLAPPKAMKATSAPSRTTPAGRRSSSRSPAAARPAASSPTIATRSPPCAATRARRRRASAWSAPRPAPPPPIAPSWSAITRCAVSRSARPPRSAPASPRPASSAASASTAPRSRLLIADRARGWRPVTAPVAEIAGVAVIVVDDGTRSRAWLIRAGRAGAQVAPLLADRVGDRRHYVYAGALPELGWVNRFDLRRSLGLDGWVHAAVTATEPPEPIECGTLAPPRDTAAVPATVCAPSDADGVLECRVAIDPQLELRLRHLTELLALDPRPLAKEASPATRAAFVLLRGDTGEILAAGDFVPGRASPVYAPGTPAIERALAALREEPGEASAEKADLHRPIAAGSTFKPFVARAAELVSPDLTGRLEAHLEPEATRTCRRGKRVIHDLLGHCPPRELLDQRGHGAGWVGFHAYLAGSSNAFQALLGLVAPGWPDGTYRTGDLAIAVDEVLDYATTGWPDPLIVEHGDGVVIGERSVRIDPLRSTPFWQRLEGLLGRPMCALGSKDACRRAADRRDLCAARALPVTAPTADLRHLVGLGPSTFDMYPAGGKAGADAVPISEYFQLLRGSGVHPLGSLAQLTDAFNRLVFDPTPQGGAHRLAASWFPVPPTGRLPAEACSALGRREAQVLGDDGGLCGVLRPGGTAARTFAGLLADPRLVLYGAKTGTIDNLGDVAERPKACAAWNQAHTIAGSAHQPYHLRCGGASPTTACS